MAWDEGAAGWDPELHRRGPGQLAVSWCRGRARSLGGRRAGRIPRGTEEIAGIPPAAALPFPRRGHPPPAGRVRGARQRSRRLVPGTARGILPQPHHQRPSHSPPASGCSEAPRVLVLQTPQVSQASCLLVSNSGRANRQRPREGQLAAQWSPPLQRLYRTGSAHCEPPHPTKAEKVWSLLQAVGPLEVPALAFGKL